MYNTHAYFAHVEKSFKADEKELAAMAEGQLKLTQRAENVRKFAQEEAFRFNHNYIGTEHLLLGLVREDAGVAARVLHNLGVDLQKVRGAVEWIIGRGDRAVLGEVGLTPRAKKVMELATSEARRLHHDYLGTEHILLGLVREGEGIAAGVLESLGATFERVRAETTRIVGSKTFQPELKSESTTNAKLDPDDILLSQAKEVLTQFPSLPRLIRLYIGRSPTELKEKINAAVEAVLDVRDLATVGRMHVPRTATLPVIDDLEDEINEED